MVVVVVDDNPDDRALVRHQLDTVFPGVVVREATDEADFVAAFGDGAGVDLVVTDYNLKWSDGLKILARVKAARPDCPVIMFTGTGDEETAVAGMKAGLDDYVVKSVKHFPAFRTSARTVVENARQRVALRESEASLREALAHKDLLLRELNHRVKNNLQTAIALLNLRARNAEPTVRAALQEAADRLHVLAQVQGRLLESRDFGVVDFTAILRDLAQGLSKVHGGKKIQLQLEVKGQLLLSVARAAPLGLLCHELIVNAYKHAFPSGEGGILRVRADSQAHGHGEITIADDGPGFDPGAVARGTGWTLADALALEAGAEIEVASEPDRGALIRLRLLPSEGERNSAIP